MLACTTKSYVRPVRVRRNFGVLIIESDSFESLPRFAPTEAPRRQLALALYKGKCLHTEQNRVFGTKSNFDRNLFQVLIIKFYDIIIV